MKAKLLVILFLISSLSFSQNWSQVGMAEFTDFASDGAIAFNLVTGSPYVVYTNVSDNNKPYVVTYDGSNWVAVGSAVSTLSSANVAIAIDPITNQPVVAYRRTATNTMDAYRFDGTNWVAVFTNISTGSALSDHRLQIQINASQTIRVAGRQITQNLAIVERNLAGTGPNYIENLIHTNNQFNGDHRYDYNDFDTYFISWENNLNSSRAGRKLIGSANNIFQTQVLANGTTFKNVSGALGTQYYAVFNDVINTTNDEIRVMNGSTFLKSEPAANDIVEIRESTTDNKLYLMYADNTTEDIIFENYNTNTNNWQTLPAINLNSGIADFFVKMNVSTYDGNVYVLYLDNGKISVRKYNVVAPLNLARIYVNQNAIGTGDGSSWSNGYNSLSDALNNTGLNTTEIWVASGTYSPGTARTDSFNFNISGLSIYGGFDGTEATIGDRDIIANPTILSGDVNGDDTGVDFTGNGRAENNYKIAEINASNVTIDGIKFEDGQANDIASGSANSYGSGITIASTVTNPIIRNCEFNNNVTYNGGAIRAFFNISTELKIENCTFNRNVGRYGSGIYVLVGANKTMLVRLTNNLFSNNTSKDYSASNLGFIGSAAWLRANSTGSNLNTIVSNCTFVNNIDTGTTQGVAEHGPLGLAKNTANTSTHNTSISNSIFYGNKGLSNATALAVSKGHTASANQTLVNNSIDEDGFSNLTFLTNISNSSPLFNDSTNGDFTLQTGSPAIDSGDNSKVPAGITTDLLGNQRIFNTTVDMGAYEFGAPAVLGVDDFRLETSELVIYPNPVSDILNIQNLDNQISEISIFNMLGQQVLKTKNKQIDVSNFKNGMFIIKAKTVSGDVVRRFVKQ